MIDSSIPDIYATLSPEHQERVKAKLPSSLKSIIGWRFGQARPNQVPPPGDWRICAFMSGRGWGKTRTAAEHVKAHGLLNPRSRIAVAAPTYGDGRDICIEGESGLLSILPSDTVRSWNRSLGELRLHNGSTYKVVAADIRRAGRGPQWTMLWGEELAEWRYPDTWKQLMLGLRLGDDPKAIVTFTPKPVQLVRDVVYSDDTLLIRGSTYDNRANLAENMFREIVERYEGTTLGQQEIYGELFEEMPGALWARATLERNRVQEFPELSRVVVAVDPQATNTDEGSETGITVAGKGYPTAIASRNGERTEHAYVLEDRSGYYSPNEWAKHAVDAYHAWDADAILYETNHGGDMVRHVLHQKDPTANLVPVRAKKGKYTRAEPVAALDERGLVHHVGLFSDMEDQMCSFTLDEAPLGDDRIDSRVYAILHLMIKGSWKERTLVGGYN